MDITSESTTEMRVLFVTRKYPPVKGGMERVSYDLYTSLSKIVSLSLIKPSMDYPAPFSVLLLFLKVLRELSRGDYDIVYLQDCMLSPIILVAKIFRVPTVVSAHGLDVVYPNPLYRLMTRIFLGKADRVICVSSATRAACKERSIATERTVIIPNGLNTSKWDEIASKIRERESQVTVHNENMILSVGRLVERKGFHWFISHVLPLVISEVPNVRYTLIGNGKMRKEIEHAVSKTKLKDRVMLLGKASDDEVAKAYVHASVMVTPNIPIEGELEGFGVGNLEAAYFGVPVVAAKLEGIPDAVIEGVTGTLVEPLDSSEFAGRISGILKGEIRFDRQLMRQTIRQRYSWDSIALNFRSEFDKVLQERC